MSSHEADAGWALHLGAVDKTVSGHFTVVSSVILFTMLDICPKFQGNPNLHRLRKAAFAEIAQTA